MLKFIYIIMMHFLVGQLDQQLLNDAVSYTV